MITFSGFTLIQLLTLLVSVLLPAAVALITTRMASSGLKAVVLLALAALVGFLSELLDALVHGTAFDVGVALFTWLTAFIVAVASHFGLLKPAGLTGSRGVIAEAVPGGIGEDQPGKHAVDRVRLR